MQKPKRVHIVWEDCYVLDSATWVEKEDGPHIWKPYLVEQVGFLLYDGPEGIVVTDSWTDNDHVGVRTQIPRGMIRSIAVDSGRNVRQKKGKHVVGR